MLLSWLGSLVPDPVPGEQQEQGLAGPGLDGDGVGEFPARGLPVLSATSALMTHDYAQRHHQPVRALEMASGSVIAQLDRRHRHQEPLRFRKLIDATAPSVLELHLIRTTTPSTRSGGEEVAAAPPTPSPALPTAASPSSKPIPVPGPTRGTPTRSHSCGPDPRRAPHPSLRRPGLAELWCHVREPAGRGRAMSPARPPARHPMTGPAQPGCAAGRPPVSTATESGARIRHASVTSSASRSTSTAESRNITSGQPS